MSLKFGPITTLWIMLLMAVALGVHGSWFLSGLLTGLTLVQAVTLVGNKMVRL